jgi:ABC-type antimicrobial peptide transport system permease subunit
MRRFLRGIFIFLIGGLVGTAFGIGAGFFLFPFVFPPPPAAEQLAEADRTQRIASGSFIHANPSDPIHWGRGKVSVYERVVFLEPDFEVGPGPKYHVYLVPRETVRASADLSGQMFVDLGRLRAFKGSQRYEVPAGVDLTRFHSVVIWCEQFSVLISPADLSFATKPQ